MYFHLYTLLSIFIFLAIYEENKIDILIIFFSIVFLYILLIILYKNFKSPYYDRIIAVLYNYSKNNRNGGNRIKAYNNFFSY